LAPVVSVSAARRAADVSAAGDLEFDHPFLTAVASVLEYCTARDAIREGLDGITCLRQEEE
jgi:hypothetical protein